jgi:4,5-dihydroxyphthalate decarboxylase
MTALRLACRSYDRTSALETGRVHPEGVELSFVAMRPDETLTRQLKEPDFECSEMSMAAHLINTARGESTFVALPVFMSRKFRHGSIYLAPQNAGAAPADLAGMRVGVPQYHSTAAVWIRGMLSDDHGVAPDAMRWVRGGLRSAGLPERIRLDLPASFDLEESPRPLDELLRAGEIDALISAVAPPAIGDASSGVTRLFADPIAASAEYYGRTGFFPIMHCIALRREVYENDPWLVGSLIEAFTASRDLAYADLTFSGSSRTMLPWEEEWFAQARAALGDGYWRYGVESSAHELAAMVRYLQEQGLIDRPLGLDEIFPPEVFVHEHTISTMQSEGTRA